MRKRGRGVGSEEPPGAPAAYPQLPAQLASLISRPRTAAGRFGSFSTLGRAPRAWAVGISGFATNLERAALPTSSCSPASSARSPGDFFSQGEAHVLAESRPLRFASSAILAEAFCFEKRAAYYFELRNTAEEPFFNKYVRSLRNIER